MATRISKIFCSVKKMKKIGASRELNPGPPVPKTGIIPLDYSPWSIRPQKSLFERKISKAKKIKFKFFPLFSSFQTLCLYKKYYHYIVHLIFLTYYSFLVLMSKYIFQ